MSLTEQDAQPDFAPCPLCKQYNHSIGEDAFADAFNHFHSMYAHPLRGHPMGHWFDEKTRDAAQVLMTAALASRLRDPTPEELERARQRIDSRIADARDEITSGARPASGRFELDA